MSAGVKGPAAHQGRRWRAVKRQLQIALAIGASFCVGVRGAGEARGSVTDLAEHLSSFLGQVPKAPGATAQDQERRLILNGQPLRMVTGHTSASVRQTLAFYRQHFDAQAQAPRLGLRMLGVLSTNDQSGYLVMVDTQSRQVLAAVAGRQLPFLAAGPLRMAFAQRRGSGTDYLTVSSETALRSEQLHPTREQDVPGQDITQVPRPPGSVRRMNLREPAAGYSLLSYYLDTPPEAALEAAKDALRAVGFQEDADFVAAGAQVSPLVTQLQRQGLTVLLRARVHKSAGSEVTYLCHGK